LGFAHTVGEFGLVLMIGGNIPGETKVVSVQLYDHVEALAYAEAHGLALLLLGFSFLVLVALYALQSKAGHGHARPANGQVMP
ncbi:MAG: molybdate ABC transporter permease subunit, partial [Pseudomonadales bacterium]